jgi:hypothetical protein
MLLEQRCHVGLLVGSMLKRQQSARLEVSRTIAGENSDRIQTIVAGGESASRFAGQF